MSKSSTTEVWLMKPIQDLTFFSKQGLFFASLEYTARYTLFILPQISIFSLLFRRLTPYYCHSKTLSFKIALASVGVGFKRDLTLCVCFKRLSLTHFPAKPRNDQLQNTIASHETFPQFNSTHHQHLWFFRIGHFPVTPSLCLKARLRATNEVFLLTHIKLIFTRKDSESFWKSEMAY